MEVKSKNTILVPTDFSDVADNALDHAVQIAKLFDNEIALLHIVEEKFLSALINIGSYGEIKDQLLQEALQIKLDKVAQEIKDKHGIKVTHHIKHGRIYKKIVDTAKELGCDSIVMGTHGASGIEQIIGSNASRVISHSSVPVIVVKTKIIGEGYKNIVLPLDLTAESKQKVHWAIYLSKYFKSTVHILTYKDSDEFLHNKIMGNLKQVQNALSKNGVEHTTKLLDSDSNFAHQTLKYAQEINADLIMIMTQQEKEFGEYIIGSYAQQIVNNAADTPVMCINPKETAFVAAPII